ncbi:MAG: PIN domain-containing protein [Bryobacteraceae bacterium]
MLGRKACWTPPAHSATSPVCARSGADTAGTCLGSLSSDPPRHQSSTCEDGIRLSAIPSVVAYEIEYGTLKLGSSHRRALASALLDGLDQVPFDHAAAREAARIRVDLEARGLTIGPLDLLIAGTAVSRGAVLVTHNTREFSRVKGLRLSDWAR